jgi:NADH:ubiquinone oxidoreductase subunit 5 (subunit L)/multisubunit Na+/H+ antiporter MnhA subunit
MYSKIASHKDPLPGKLGALHTFIVNKYYLDDLFLAIANFFQSALAKVLFWFDSQIIIKSAVNGVAGATYLFGGVLRRLQTGNLRTYAMAFGFAVVTLVYLFMMKG